MAGFWTVFWLAVVLKIPIVALFYIVWWATRPPEVEVEPVDDGGGSDRLGHGPRIKPPRPPRRGPHADALPASPSRVRARARSQTFR
jgi:hypothetical protein